ncbi:hypothetical protein Q4Q39_19825 [Flavivirga amylovorans]|uniref:Uncharacterized protein n=1 Tax=Flavivirga amylovorans TaxID=870486 RepID=A0ABT8X6Q7_9FLAO|nr:hypothetical protein [Flavivirga amylovorans]MDO5989659.1 hypothetical protein [Flavivirga amylovorans]
MLKLFYYIIFLIGLIGFSQTKNFSIKNLEINTEYPHFGLMPINDSKVVFTSYLLDKKGRLKRYEGNPILTIFEGNLSEEGHIVNVAPIQIDPKQNISHITSATISPDGKHIYLATNYTRKNMPKGNFNEANFHITVGEYKTGIGWTNFNVLPFCKLKYSYAHPALSKDGKTLYFTANIRGGKETTRGGSDIFKVDILKDGRYSEPKNLGSKVNSYSREMFPFISSDGILYFASNRPNGFGGFDIYKSIVNDEGVFKKAEKLPKPINSKQDDFCLIVDVEKGTGYFSSKRQGGKGDDDIYFFVIK